MAHGEHSEGKRGEQTILKIAISITGSIMIFEVVGGILSNSLALLSDAWHMLVDLLALTLCLIAGTVAARPHTLTQTFGYHRIEIVTALGNGVTLVAAAIYIFYEAINRFIASSIVLVPEMLTVALIGLIANSISLVLLSRTMMSLNIRAAFLHVAGDLLSSVGVVAAGVIMFYTNWYFVDTIMGMAVGAIIVFGTGRMLKEVLHILLEGTPKEIDIKSVVGTIRSVTGVMDVHDLHVWSITSYMHYLTAHLVVSRANLSNASMILNEAKEKLAREHRIKHTTIQLESEDYKEIGEIHRLLE